MGLSEVDYPVRKLYKFYNATYKHNPKGGIMEKLLKKITTVDLTTAEEIEVRAGIDSSDGSKKVCLAAYYTNPCHVVYIGLDQSDAKQLAKLLKKAAKAL